MNRTKALYIAARWLANLKICMLHTSTATELLHADASDAQATWCAIPHVMQAMQVKAVIVECACVIELPDLKGVAKLKEVPLYIQVQKEGD